MTRHAVLLFALAARMTAQPGIGQNGVVNAASQIPPTLAGGALARGTAFTIHGVRFGAKPVISLEHGRSVIKVPVLSSQPKRIDAVLPPDAPLGPASLSVSVDGQAGKAFAIDIVASNPGIFTRNGLGWGPGRIEHVGPRKARSPNSFSNPAHAGQRVTLRVAGLGGAQTARVVIGNRTVVAQATATSDPGVEELILEIPRDATQGCYVPVYIKASPGRASNVATMALRNRAGPCEAGAVPLLDNTRIGMAVLTRTRMRRKDTASDLVFDEAIVAFAAKDKEPVLAPLLLLPPAGTCTAYWSSFQSVSILPDSPTAALVSDLGGRGLDAGPRVTIRHGSQSRNAPRDPAAPGFFRVRLGSNDRRGGRAAFPPLLEPGLNSITGYGGSDVGPFAIQRASPPEFAWTGRDALNVVDRGRDLTVHWSGVSADRLMLVVATNVDQITTANGICLCAAAGSAGKMTIPAALLANLPASKDMPGIPYDQLVLVSIPAKAGPSLPVSGLNGGGVIDLYAVGRFVDFR
ncbi:MAG: hypothetical protein ABI823_12780 [Bryobacteraceae bacterium]